MSLAELFGLKETWRQRVRRTRRDWFRSRPQVSSKRSRAHLSRFTLEMLEPRLLLNAAPVIEAAERNGQNWRAAVAESGVDADGYIFRDRSQDVFLPWDIIDGGMKASFFQSEYEKSLRAEWTLPPKRQQENARLLPML